MQNNEMESLMAELITPDISNVDVSKLLLCSSRDLEFYYFACFSKNNPFPLRTKLFRELINITGPNFVFMAPKSKSKNLNREMTLLHMAILNNEIGFVCQLLKNGVDINIQSNIGGNVLHFCIINNNYELLNFFVKKNVDINAKNIANLTPLLLALTYNKYDYAKLLIENGADILIKDNNNINALDFITYKSGIQNINEKDEIYSSFCDFFKFITEKKYLQNNYEENIVTLLIENKNLNLLKIMIENSENLIDKYNIIQKFFFECDFDDYLDESNKIIIELLDTKKYNIIPREDGNSIFNNCLITCQIKPLEKILSFKPDIITLEKDNYIDLKNKISSLYSPYDHLLSNYHLIIDGNFALYYKPTNQIIKIIELLINYGLDINEPFGEKLFIEYAIQYKGLDFVKKTMNLGCNIKGLGVDLLNCAVKYENMRVFNFLLENDANMYYLKSENNMEIPICLLTAISKDNVEMFDFCYKKLIQFEKIKINDITQKYLAQTIINDAIINNKEMLKIINYSDINKNQKIPNFISDIIKSNNNEILFQIYDFCNLFLTMFVCDNSYDLIALLEKYDEFINSISQNDEIFKNIINIICFYCGYQNGFFFESYIYYLNNILKNNPEYNNDNDDDNNNDSDNNIFDLKYYDYENFMLSNFCNYYIKYIDEKKKYLYKIFDLMTYIKPEFPYKNKIKNEIERKFKFKFLDLSCEKEKEIEENNNNREIILSSKNENENENENENFNYENNRFKILKLKKNFKRISKSYKEKKEITKNIALQEKKYYEQFITLDVTSSFIKKSLFKLYFPIKVNHYDAIYDELKLKPRIIENKKLIQFSDNGKTFIFDKIKLSFTKKPSCWIKYYAPNIGIEEKKNFEHDIPFWIDKVIYKLNCYEDETPDINHIDKNTRMIYFVGSIIENNIKYDGVYEYFINGTGTLFHRMFRRVNKLNPNLKILFNK